VTDPGEPLPEEPEEVPDFPGEPPLPEEPHEPPVVFPPLPPEEIPPDVEIEPPPGPGEPAEVPAEEKVELAMLVYGWLRHIKDEIDEVIAEIELHVPEWMKEAMMARAKARSEAMVGQRPWQGPGGSGS
jgi:hypothetical protein